MAVPRAPSSVAERWLRTILSLRGVELRVAYLRVELERRPLSVAAEALNELAGRAEQADPLAREALAAAAPLLADRALEPLTLALRGEASARALLPLERLLRFTRGAPAAEQAEERKVALTSRGGRVLTLGERRALARRPSRSAFDGLLRDPHPMVIRNLLQNPRLTEDDVVRVATRRPAYPDVIAEIARHPVWSARPRVRLSIALNPGSPPEVTIPFLRLLMRGELAEVAESSHLPALVRAAARELLARRPPVPEDGGKGPEQ